MFKKALYSKLHANIFCGATLLALPLAYLAGAFDLSTALAQTEPPAAVAPAPNGEVPVQTLGEKGEKAEEEKGPEKISAGVIASYGNFSKTAAVNSVNQAEVPGDKASVVGGSVSRKGDSCVVTVTNQSEKDAYSISYEVVGYRGSSKAFSKYFTARLEPKGSSQKSIASCGKDINVQVLVKSGRRLGK